MSAGKREDAHDRPQPERRPLNANRGASKRASFRADMRDTGEPSANGAAHPSPGRSPRTTAHSYRGLKARSVTARAIRTGPRRCRTTPSPRPNPAYTAPLAPAPHAPLPIPHPIKQHPRDPDHHCGPATRRRCRVQPAPTRESWRGTRSAKPNWHQPERHSANDATARQRPAQRRPPAPAAPPLPDKHRPAS